MSNDGELSRDAQRLLRAAPLMPEYGQLSDNAREILELFCENVLDLEHIAECRVKLGDYKKRHKLTRPKMWSNVCGAVFELQRRGFLGNGKSFMDKDETVIAIKDGFKQKALEAEP